MADFAELARQYQGQSYGNPFMGTDMTEDGNVKLQSDSVTNQPEPVVAPAPVNPYEQQAEQLAMGVPEAGTPFTNPVPEQMAAPVAPDQMMAEQAMPDEVAALRPGQVAPAQTQDYNAYIASQESGANPNVGYHYPADAQGKRKSTAYGTYGLTAPAYRDIQMADPYFRGKDITALSPEDQARANSTYRNVQTSQLKALGLEPTDENIRGAQLLGAGGLKRYLDTGTFSNQAARANGGAQNLENILKGRMAGGAAPASQPNLPPQPQPQAAPEGAVSTQEQEANRAAPAPAPAPTDQTSLQQTAGPGTVSPQEQAAAQQPGEPYQDASGMYYDAMGNPVGMDQKQAKDISAIQTQQNDPTAMATLAYDKTVDPALRRVAAAQVRKLFQQEDETRKAEQTVNRAMTDPKEARKLTRELSKSGEEGSHLKAYLYQRLGLTDLAKAEQIKLGAGDHWSQSFLMGKDGTQQAVWIKYNGQGAPVEGYGADGQLAQDQVMAATSMKGVTAHTGKMKDRVTGEVYYEQTGPQGTRLIGPTGKVFSGDTKNLMPYGIGSDVQTKNEIQMNQLKNRLAVEPTLAGRKAAASQYMEFAAKTDPGDGSSIREAEQMINNIGFGFQNGQVVEQPGAAQQPGQAPTQAPGAAPTQAPSAAAPTEAPSTVTIPVADLRRRPGESRIAYESRLKDIERQQQSAASVAQKAAEVPIAVSETTQKEFVKTADEIRTAGKDGSDVKNLRRQQIDILKRNPEIVGILNGTGSQYDTARRFIIDSISGRYSGQEGGKERSDDLAKMTGMNQNQRDAIAEFANLTAGVNQKTLKANSGAGSISDAEQRTNKESNIQYVERGGPLMVVNELTRSQFTSDLNNAKADFLNRGQYKTRQEFDTAWNKESSKLVKQYEGIYKGRVGMLKPYLDAVEKNPNDTTALQRRRDAIAHSMTVYPAPEYDVQTGKWDYKTDNARKAAMNAVLGR